MRKLVLFDIDGTILNAGETGREATYQAIEEVCRQMEVFGENSPGEFRQVRMSGKTDTQIVHEILDGVLSENAIHRLLPSIFDRIADILTAACQKGANVKLLDGAQELISAVANYKACLLGLLTGNNKGGAAAKLDFFRLNPFFQLGAFGDDARSRNALPDIAVRRAFEQTGERFSGKDIVIIGDTPRDIKCARHAGAYVIAVATGRYSREELEKYQPDALFDNLSDTQSVMNAILSTFCWHTSDEPG
jgi:phosphoglycolate phosphatase-like HAD superfamily hydrolase